MSQGTQRKHRAALQVAAALALAMLSACATKPQPPVHASVGAEAPVLRFDRMIKDVGLGAGDAIKWVIVGRDRETLKRPVSVGIGHGVMYIADGDLNAIFRYDLERRRMEQVWNSGDFIAEDAGDIFVAPDQSFFVADTSGRRVLHVTRTGTILQSYEDGPNITRPVAVHVDAAKREVLVADEVYSHVVSFDQNKRVPQYGIGGRGEGEGKFRIITDMLVTDDAFYIGDRVELRVQKLDREGRFIEEIGAGEIMFPTALARDAYGRLYVADKMDSKIKVFDGNKLIAVVGKNGYDRGEFRFISDMKVHDNELFVVDSLNGRIQVFRIQPPASAS